MLLTRGKRQLAFGVITNGDGSSEEVDSLTCYHCGRVVWMKPFQDGAAMGGHCSCCDHYICLQCVGKGCTPLQKRLDQEERRAEYARG